MMGVKGTWSHGTNSGYQLGCRCEQCCEAHREYHRKYGWGWRARPEVGSAKRAYDAARYSKPELRARKRAYNQSYHSRPEVQFRNTSMYVGIGALIRAGVPGAELLRDITDVRRKLNQEEWKKWRSPNRTKTA